MSGPDVEFFEERCAPCVGTGSIESSDSTDESWWDCRACGGTGKRGWRWRVRAGNGEIVATGESYTRREDAVRGFHDAAEAFRVVSAEIA